MKPSSRVLSGVLLATFTLVALAPLVACEPSSSPSAVDPPVTMSPSFMPPSGMTTATAPAGTATTAPPTARSWGPAVMISDATATSLRGDPAVAIDATGNAVAVWRETLSDSTRNAVMATRHEAGGAWSKPMTIDNTIGSSGPPQLAMAPNGTAVAAFTQFASNQGGQQLVVTNRFTGSTWGGPMTLSTTGLTPEDPFIALGDDGEATLVFRAADGTYPRPWAARSSASGVFADPVEMQNDAQPGLFASVTVSTSGDAVMTWIESTGAPSAAAVWASRHHAGVWDAPVRISPDNGLALVQAVLGTDASGDVVALWSQRVGDASTPYALRSARMNGSTGTWSTPITVSDGAHEVTGPRLSVNAAGEAAAVWFETNHGVVASRFSSSTSTWGAPVLLQAASGQVAYPSPSVGIDAKGNAVASWVQPTGATPAPRLFAAHLSSDAGATGTWSAPIDLLTDPSATPYAAETQLSVDASGEAVVVWHQDSGPSSTPGIWARIYR